MSGELIKMKIEAYADANLSTRAADPNEFSVQVNPESYTLNSTVQYTPQLAQGKSGAQQSFNQTIPGMMNFDFLFDATGVLAPGGFLQNIPFLGTQEDMDVSVQVDKFKAVVLNYNTDTHEPCYLKLVWGPFLFKCRLASLSIKYKLFKSDGTPIRAVATCGFHEHTPEQENLSTGAAESPDLTHVRTVTEGDALPLMCYKIYGDSKYYTEIARVNKLNNFRKLKAGTKIIFPPLEKATK
jgi:nucleoid-associated protein YgaU